MLILKNLKLLLLLFITLFLIPSNGLCQENQIKINFIGNCGLHLTDGITNIYVDFPYKSGAHGYMEFDESELDSIKENSIFIFTHKHSDHYSSKNIRRVIKSKKGKKYGSWNIKKLKSLSESIPCFNIKPYRTKHKWSLNHYSYLITWHDQLIFFSGDTESAELIGTVKNIDWAFVPYWLLMDAKENDIKIDAKKIGIYHLSTSQIPSAKKVFQNVDNYFPLVEQGSIIHIDYKKCE